MSKEMICPVCKKAKLVRFFNPLTGKYHEDYDCPYRLCNFRGNEVAVNALIQSQRDLQIVRLELEDIKKQYEERLKAERDGFTVNWDVWTRKISWQAFNTLAQITHDNKSVIN